MQSGHMRTYPDADVREIVEVTGLRIWFVLVNRRSPVNGNTAQDEAEKYRHIQPMTPSHQKMVLLGHEHAPLFRKRACAGRFIFSKC